MLESHCWALCKVLQINALVRNQNMCHFNKYKPELILICEKTHLYLLRCKRKVNYLKAGREIWSIRVTNGKNEKMPELFRIQSNAGWRINRHQIKIQWNPEHSKNKRFWLDSNGSVSKDIRRMVKLVIWLGEIGNRPISICRSDGGEERECVQLGVAVKWWVRARELEDIRRSSGEWEWLRLEKHSEAARRTNVWYDCSTKIFF